MSDYFDLSGVSWSKHLKPLRDDSPLRLRWLLDHPDERPTTPDMTFGRAVHMAVFEPDRFEAEVVCLSDEARDVWMADHEPDMGNVVEAAGRKGSPAWRAQEAENPRSIILPPAKYLEERTKRTKAAFVTAHAGKILLKPVDYQRCIDTTAAVRAHPLVVPLLADGQPEVTIEWTDPATGLPCKGRLDWECAGGAIVDLKTAATIHEPRFWAQAARLGYHGQAAHYSAGVEVLRGYTPRFFIVAVEKTAPFDVAVWEFTGADLQLGRQERDAALALYRHCLDTDTWPGRYSEIMPSAIPDYLFPQDIEPEGDSE